MMNAAGPMVSSSIAERMPPCTKPAGLQKSRLPSKPMRIQPSFGRASSTCQPSNLEDGGVGILSSAVAIMGTSVRLPSKAGLLPAWCQQAAARCPAGLRLPILTASRLKGWRWSYASVRKRLLRPGAP